MKCINIFDTKLAYLQIGKNFDENIPQIIWGHGWKQTHFNLLHLAQALENFFSHYLIDFPGFGDSIKPNVIGGSELFADYIAHFLQKTPRSQKRIWVGFSFGCRVGLYLAHKYPHLIDGLVLVAAPGLPKTRPITLKAKIKGKIFLYKMLKHFLNAQTKTFLMKHHIIGSRDYVQANDMKPFFLEIIKEDFENVAKKIRCPVLLIYGAQDNEAPSYMGRRYLNIIPKATLKTLPNCDHYNLLFNEQQKIIYFIKQLIETL